MGFNRVPPTAGRVFDMTKEIMQKADTVLTETFFYSPANNTVCQNSLLKINLKILF